MMGTKLTDRAADLAEGARHRMTQSRLEKLDHDNERLRGEIDSLREDLGDEREAVKAAEKRAGKQTRRTSRDRARRKTKRSVSLFRTAMVAGGAYVLGARAGRARYQQIVDRTRSLTDLAKRKFAGDGGGWELNEPASVLPEDRDGREATEPTTPSSQGASGSDGRL